MLRHKESADSAAGLLEATYVVSCLLMCDFLMQYQVVSTTVSRCQHDCISQSVPQYAATVAQ